MASENANGISTDDLNCPYIGPVSSVDHSDDLVATLFQGALVNS